MTRPLDGLLRRLPAGSLLLVALLSVGCMSTAQDRDADSLEARLSEVREDIALLEEFNRLELTKPQLQSLVEQTDALHGAMAARKALRMDILNLLQALLEEQRTSLLKDEPIAPALARQVDDQTLRLQEFDQATDQELLRFAGPLKELLSPAQVDILTWASEARLQASEYLDWVRSMSAEDFEAEAEMNAEGLAEGRAITKEEILDLYRTARGMGDDEYAQAKDVLADKLAAAFRDDSTPLDLVLIQRLQPDRVPVVLKEKLAQMK
jgi:hypothetical protein